MRKEPDIAPPTEIEPRQLNMIEQRRKYKLITPLYGGGVNPTKADPITIVRATEIRAQLRFWWRACRGWQFGNNSDAMRNEEGAIWGKAYEKGDQGIPFEQTIQVTVSIDSTGRGEPVKPFVVQNGRPKPTNGIPGYAAFPLQPNEKERRKPQPHIPEVYKSVYFMLTISYPTVRSQDVEAALWAWETFGGLGARTRRGFGALHLLAINDVQYKGLPASYRAEAWIKKTLDHYIELESFPVGIPHLSTRQLIVTAPYNDPIQAWSSLIRALQQFRQRKDDTRRSAWPEAEAIRAITGQPLKNKQPGLQKFPRVAFGLPIIFHFTGDGEPADTTLNEAGDNDEVKKRFASPLILRPFLCGDNRAVGLALVLEGSQVDLQHLVLEESEKTLPYPVQGTLTKSEAQKIAGLDGEPNVLRAFMNSLKEGC